MFSDFFSPPLSFGNKKIGILRAESASSVERFAMDLRLYLFCLLSFLCWAVSASSFPSASLSCHAHLLTSSSVSSSRSYALRRPCHKPTPYLRLIFYSSHLFFFTSTPLAPNVFPSVSVNSSTLTLSLSFTSTPPLLCLASFIFLALRFFFSTCIVHTPRNLAALHLPFDSVPFQK